jgi:hypothetical protein
MENPIATLEAHAQKQGLSLDEWIGTIRTKLVSEKRFLVAPGAKKISKAESKEETLKYRQWVLQKMPSDKAANV